jgi:hypothetical protein
LDIFAEGIIAIIILLIKNITVYFLVLKVAKVDKNG